MVESLGLDSHFEDGDTRAQTAVFSLPSFASSSRWCLQKLTLMLLLFQHSASSAKFSCQSLIAHVQPAI